jgi:hypothetical protein
MAKLYAVHTKILSTENRDKGIAFFYHKNIHHYNHHYHRHHHSNHERVTSVGSIHYTDKNSTRQTFVRKGNSFNSYHCKWSTQRCLPSHNIQVTESNAPHVKKYIYKVLFIVFTIHILCSTYVEKSKTQWERILTNKFIDFSTPWFRFLIHHWRSRVCLLTSDHHQNRRFEFNGLHLHNYDLSFLFIRPWLTNLPLLHRY